MINMMYGHTSVNPLCIYTYIYVYVYVIYIYVYGVYVYIRIRRYICSASSGFRHNSLHYLMPEIFKEVMSAIFFIIVHAITYKKLTFDSLGLNATDIEKCRQTQLTEYMVDHWQCLT